MSYADDLERWVKENPHPTENRSRVQLYAGDWARVLTILRSSEAEQRWIPVSERLPKAETPVLVLCRNAPRIGELRWERPSYEETWSAFQYWDDPENDGQDWDWPEVTHWMPLPPVPSSSAAEEKG